MVEDGSDVSCLLAHNRMDTVLRLLSTYVDTATYPRTPFQDVSRVLSELFDRDGNVSVSGVGTFQGIDEISDYFLLARPEFNGGNFHYINTTARHMECISDDIATIETNELVQLLDTDDVVQNKNQQTIAFMQNSSLLLSLSGYNSTPILENLSLSFDVRDLCDNAIFACPFPLYPFESIQECYDMLSTLPPACNVDGGGGLLMGNTVACRAKHLTLSRIDPLRHCPLLNSTSESCRPEDCPMLASVVLEPESYEAQAGFPTWLRIIDAIVVSFIAVIPIITFALYRKASRRVADSSTLPRAVEFEGSMYMSSSSFRSRRRSSHLYRGGQSDRETNDYWRTSAYGDLEPSAETEESEEISLRRHETTTDDSHRLPVLKLRGLELHWTSKKSTQEDSLVVKSDMLVLGGCKLTAIRGKSGSGKSTLIKLLSGFHQNHMEIEYDEILENPPIGYCSQSPDIWPRQMKVRDVLLFSCKLYGSNLKDFEAVFEGLGILNLFDLCFGVLSGGEQQRVHMATSICRTHPSVIFLDEPLASLDSVSALNCLRLLELLPTHHAYVLVVHQTDDKVAREFNRTIELNSMTNEISRVGESGGTVEEHFQEEAAPLHSSRVDTEINRNEGSFFWGFQASIILWHSQFFGIPIIELGTALCSALGAVFYGLMTRETFLESPLPAEYGLRIGHYVAFIIMAAAIITSFCYSLLFAPRERPLVVNLVAQRSLKASAYTIAVLVRTLYYGFFQAAIWFFLVLLVMGVWDAGAALDLTFNVTFFLAGWSALTFTVAYVSSFMAAHLIMILICGALFLSGLVAPWAAIPDYLRILHYPNPSFTTIEACKNYFFAEVMDSECGDFDHFTVCATSDRLADLLDVQPIYSPVAQAYSLFIISISSFGLWLYLKPRRWRLRLQRRKPKS